LYKKFLTDRTIMANMLNIKLCKVQWQHNKGDYLADFISASSAVHLKIQQ